MFKKKYIFLIINNTSDVPIEQLLNKNITIILRIEKKINIENLISFRVRCKKNRVKLFIANDIMLMNKLKADGLYISAWNKSLKARFLDKKRFSIIGACHNYREINIKINQGCRYLLLSRLFKTNYKFKKGFLGVIKFNLLCINTKIKFIPLGGIKLSKINALHGVLSNGLAVSSDIKKKPANIINRLFYNSKLN